MNVIGVGEQFWKICNDMLTYGHPPMMHYYLAAKRMQQKVIL